MEKVVEIGNGYLAFGLGCRDDSSQSLHPEEAGNAFRHLAKVLTPHFLKEEKKKPVAD